MHKEIVYGPDLRYGNLKFGYGFYSLDSQTKESESLELEAFKLGWSNGCPIATELLSPQSEYNLEWMIQRYSETNFWFYLANHEAANINKAVYQFLQTSRLRLLSEPTGKHYPECVPLSHIWKISPMSGVYGYATPRVLIEMLRKYGPGNEVRQLSYELLTDTIKRVGDQPNKFLPLLSEKVALRGVDPEIILSHIYPQGILQEENCYSEYKNLTLSIEKFAPTIWKTYVNLPEPQRKELAIADISFPN